MKVLKWYDVCIVVGAWIAALLIISAVWFKAETMLYGHAQSSAVDAVVTHYLSARFAAWFLRVTMINDEKENRR